MTEVAKMEPINVPVSLVRPVKLKKEAETGLSGLFFPYGTILSLGLVVDWDGGTRLIHLDGQYIFKQAAIDIGSSIRGIMIEDIEYQVDVTSRYNCLNAINPPGALIIRDGQIYLSCEVLGDQFHNGPSDVPLGKKCPTGGADESCGFTRWSLAVREGNKLKIVRSFEAGPSK